MDLCHDGKIYHLTIYDNAVAFVIRINDDRLIFYRDIINGIIQWQEDYFIFKFPEPIKIRAQKYIDNLIWI